MSYSILKSALEQVHFVKRPKKEDAFTLLKEGIANGLPPEAWAQVLRYFVPAPPKTPKNVKDWLAAATDKDDRRLFCHVVHYFPKLGYVSTDGAAMHVTTQTPPGVAADAEVLSPLTWEPVIKVGYEPPPSLVDRIKDRLAAAEEPVELPPVELWPTSPATEARFVPDTKVAIAVYLAQRARVTHYLGSVPAGGSKGGFPGSALFRTPYGHAIIMPYRV